MAARVRLTVIGFGTAFLTALTIWLLAGAPGSPEPEVEARSSQYAGALRPQGMTASPFAGLKDQDGRPVRDPRGDVTVVTFLYTTCEDTCPSTAQQIRGALDRLDRPARAIAISVDPAADDGDAARTFLAKQRLTGRMEYLLGPRAALERQWKTYAVQPQLEDAEHTASVVLIDARGRQRIGFPADHLTPEGLADDIERLRRETA